MANNNNGYIGVAGQHKPITKRYIGIGNGWKEEDFKFIGYNGYWRLIYTKNPINMSAPFYIRYLDGYSLELENSITLTGFNFRDYQLVSPKVGGYFDIVKNASDLFENFTNGTYVGTPQIGALLQGRKCMSIQTALDYFELPSDLDAIGVFGSTGNKDYNLSQHFYIPTMPTGTNVIPLLSFGNNTNGMEVVVSSDGRLQQKIWISDTLYLIETAINLITTGWNSYVLTKVSGVTNIYLKGGLSIRATSTQTMVSPNAGVFIRVGSSFKYLNTTSLPQAFSINRTATRYTLSNSNKTITTVSTGNGTARSNNTISPNTGKYYFETLINTLSTGVIWVGLGDISLDQTVAIGIAGWSISSNSRTFNKQTGGGTVWGSGTRTFTTGDIIGCVYDSNAGTAIFYKNNVLLGTSTSAITGTVEFMVAGDINTVSTMRIKNTEWSYSTPIAGAVEMPTNVTYSGLTYYSTAGTGHSYIYQTSTLLSNENIDKLLNRANPVVIIKNKESLVETIIPEQWMLTVNDTVIVCTIPNTVIFGQYDLFIRYFSGLESFRFPISIKPVNIQDVSFVDDYSDKYTLSNNYYVLDKAWGGSNGGVVKENVFIRDGELILRGNGDRYTGTVQGKDRIGNPKFHTQVGDPKLGLPWTNRVGGCIVFNKRTGFGSYEIDTIIPNKLGCAYALWTFFYNEIYPSDPRYNDFLIEGLHQQGTIDDGYYLTRNHEIDIEFPSHLDGGTLSNPSLSNFKANTWRGELQNWDVPTTDPTYYEEYRDNLTPVGFNIADGQYHKLRYDWYPDRVEFYIDGILKRTNINTSKGDTIPDIPGFFTFGIWFPSSPLAAKPWLTNPTKAWGGGVIDSDGGMKADFESVEMRVRKFKFTPYNQYQGLERRVGETYPFGGYNKK
jgi:hypothetical protein